MNPTENKQPEPKPEEPPAVADDLIGAIGAAVGGAAAGPEPVLEKAVSEEVKSKASRKKKINEQRPPLPDEAKPAPGPPKVAQKDAAKAFFAATASSQAFQAATDGLLGAVRLGLPDADVYFRTKPIEEVINKDGTKSFLNQAKVSLYRLPDGARQSSSEPRLWLIDKPLASAFKERKAKIKEYQLRLAVDRQGTPYLIPVPIDALDIWSSSLRTVMAHSDKKWLKIYSDPKKGRQYEFGDEQDLEPTFPAEDFEELFMLALMPVFVNSKEHDIYKRVCGA